MGKKPSIKGKGLDALLGETQQNSKEVKQQEIRTAEQQNSRTAEKEKLIKRTFYITEEEDLILEEIKLRRRERGEKIDKSGLIREAIKLLAAKESPS